MSKNQFEKTVLGSAVAVLAGIGGTSPATATPAPPAALSGQDVLPIAVTRNQIRATGNGVEINNAELARALKTDHAGTVQFLAQRFPGLQASQVSVSKTGAVMIASNSVKRDLGKGMDGDVRGNGLCGNVKCGGAVMPGSAASKIRTR